MGTCCQLNVSFASSNQCLMVNEFDDAGMGTSFMFNHGIQSLLVLVSMTQEMSMHLLSSFNL